MSEVRNATYAHGCGSEARGRRVSSAATTSPPATSGSGRPGTRPRARRPRELSVPGLLCSSSSPADGDPVGGQLVQHAVDSDRGGGRASRRPGRRVAATMVHHGPEGETKSVAEPAAQVGVHEAKTQLSELLRLIDAGGGRDPAQRRTGGTTGSCGTSGGSEVRHGPRPLRRPRGRRRASSTRCARGIRAVTSYLLDTHV